MIKNLHRWTRLSSAKWEDAWVERLRFLGPEQVAFVTWPDSRALKIEAYCDEPTARRLVSRFGGRHTKIAPHIWTGDPARPRAPLSIRGKLKVFSDSPSWLEWKKTKRKPIGAVALGAGRVEALDFDPHAVRIAKQNTKANGCRTITTAPGNVLELKTAKPYDVVLANLFSDVLIAAAPRIARAVKPGSWFIFSGVLRKQAAEVAGVLQTAGFSSPRIIPRGKWCAGICTRQKKS